MHTLLFLRNVLIMILAPLGASLTQMAISRIREFQADASGAAICGHYKNNSTLYNE